MYSTYIGTCVFTLQVVSRRDREAHEAERHELTESLMDHIGDLLVKVRMHARTYLC